MMSKALLMYLAGALSALLLIGAYYAVKSIAAAQVADQRIVYLAEDGTPLELHVFNAHGHEKDQPSLALLLFHGGRWQYGRAAQFFPQCEALRRQGITCISAEYRIKSKHGTTPEQALDDAKRAYQHVWDSAAALNIDRTKIAVGGGSSGGQLAAALGTRLFTDLARNRPAALVLYNPMLDLSPCRPDHHLLADDWLQMSPLQNVDDATPPSLVMLGTEDKELPVASAEAFCAAVQAQGGRCELAVYPGADHGFFNPQVEQGRYFEQTQQRVLAFLQSL